MTATKRVRIIVPEVHDGLGGVHREGDMPTLPVEIADIFIERSRAIPADSSLTAEEARIKGGAVIAAHAAESQAERARGIMENHDNLTEAERQAAYERDYKWIEPSSTTTKPQELELGTSPPETEGSDLSPRPTASPSSTSTSPCSPDQAETTGRETSGKRRRSRT